jgi:hypothetical protein
VPVVPLREAAGELRLAAGRARARVKADQCAARDLRRACAAVAHVTPGDDKHRCPPRPGQLQGRVQSIARAGQHHDGTYLCRHSLSRPHEEARGSRAERDNHGERDDHDQSPTLMRSATPVNRRMPELARNLAYKRASSAYTRASPVLPMSPAMSSCGREPSRWPRWRCPAWPPRVSGGERRGRREGDQRPVCGSRSCQQPRRGSEWLGELVPPRHGRNGKRP